jgi:ribonuclease HI
MATDLDAQINCSGPLQADDSNLRVGFSRPMVWPAGKGRLLFAERIRTVVANARTESKPPAMSVPAPHFLLYAEAAQAADGDRCEAGRWRFVLRLPGGETSLEAADDEPEAGPERLELLAVVRGLEALSQPSRVTLLSGSRQIRRGLEFGLSQWRENDWQWERYGRMAPIKNGDLWQRIDRLLDIHRLECRPSGLNQADDLALPPATLKAKATGRKTIRIDAAHAKKSAYRNSIFETNSKSHKRNAVGRRRLARWDFLITNLFLASTFVLRHVLQIRSRGKLSAHKRKTLSTIFT